MVNNRTPRLAVGDGSCVAHGREIQTLLKQSSASSPGVYSHATETTFCGLWLLGLVQRTAHNGTNTQKDLQVNVPGAISGPAAEVGSTPLASLGAALSLPLEGWRTPPHMDPTGG